jgi:CRP-like cAMP-binding protein
MFETFETFIRANGNFTDDELKDMRARAVIKKLRKKQFILQEGEICQFKAFVAKGLLRTYYIKPDGTEHTMRFSSENVWATDGHSLLNQTPTLLNIEALEDAVVIIWYREQLQEMHNIPAFKAYTDKLMSNSLKDSFERILTNISATSEEKYQAFIDLFPDVFRRVPLHMVASYLGVSRETLSRIRHAQLKQ